MPRETNEHLSLPADGAACSAVTAVGITSALLLHKHRQVRRGPLGGGASRLPSEPPAQLSLLSLQGVLLSRLMSDFAWLLEETLVRQRDVGFSGQLRALVRHSLALLRAHIALYHLAPPGDVLVVPEVSVEARWELSQHSAALLPVFAGEVVGGEQQGMGWGCP